jgi:hypothetical protein
VNPPDLRELLLEFSRDKLSEVLRHQEGAQHITHYDFNNTYQYIIAREDTQLGWLSAALADLDTAPPLAADAAPMPKGRGADLQRAILEDDVRRAQAFVERWRPRVETMTNARHRGLLRVILGETLEHKRFFEQALAGRADLLGRHVDGAGSRGSVLATRWIEGARYRIANFKSQISEVRHGDGAAIRDLSSRAWFSMS